MSNALIAIAYFSIAALLSYFVKKRRDAPLADSQPSDANFELPKPAHASLTDYLPCITICTQKTEDCQVQICIADNGISIPVNVQQKLFAPFFTTKPVGKGTGMGLAICYQIVVDQHHGSIEVRSAPGQSTEVKIILPCQQQMEQEILKD